MLINSGLIALQNTMATCHATEKLIAWSLTVLTANYDNYLKHNNSCSQITDIIYTQSPTDNNTVLNVWDLYKAKLQPIVQEK